MFCWMCYAARNVDLMFEAVHICSGCRKDINRVINFLRMYKVDPMSEAAPEPPQNGHKKAKEVPVPAKP